jgi:hypothetical protein
MMLKKFKDIVECVIVYISPFLALGIFGLWNYGLFFTDARMSFQGLFLIVIDLFVLYLLFKYIKLTIKKKSLKVSFDELLEI